MTCEHRWETCTTFVGCTVGDHSIPDVALCSCGEVFELDGEEAAAIVALSEGRFAALSASRGTEETGA